jgi:hypothetical protein
MLRRVAEILGATVPVAIEPRNALHAKRRSRRSLRAARIPQQNSRH